MGDTRRTPAVVGRQNPRILRGVSADSTDSIQRTYPTVQCDGERSITLPVANIKIEAIDGQRARICMANDVKAGVGVGIPELVNLD